MTYQKATFLIGDEMADVKNSIIDFSKYLTRILNENKDIIDIIEVIFFIKLKLRQVDETNETMSRTNERMNFLNEKIEEINKRNEEILKEIEEIKKSESYVENLLLTKFSLISSVICKIRIINRYAYIRKIRRDITLSSDYQTIHNFFFIFCEKINFCSIINFSN